MKKKIIKLLLPVLILCMTTVPVSAKPCGTLQSGALSNISAPVFVSENQPEEAEPTDTGITSIPYDGMTDQLMDKAGLLSESDAENILSELRNLSQQLQMDVVIVTVDRLDGKSAQEYADDFYDTYEYGFGNDRDGVLLLLAMEERDWWISTHGYGQTAFTDAGIDYIGDQITGELGKGNYAQAFEHYASLCEDFITQARTGDPYDTGHMPKGTVNPLWIFGDVAIGIILSLILGLIAKSKLKTVRKKESAADYTVPGSVSMYLNSDQLVNRYVTQRHIQKSSGGSGSSGHISSSGATHGGGGGKF